VFCEELSERRGGGYFCKFGWWGGGIYKFRSGRDIKDTGFSRGFGELEDLGSRREWRPTYEGTGEVVIGRVGMAEITSKPAPSESGGCAAQPPVGLWEFGVFGFSLEEDGDVGVGVFPGGEEVLIGGAGFGGVVREDSGAGNAEVG
jgi:hypothetical protein